jgi:hypothetical protein
MDGNELGVIEWSLGGFIAGSCGWGAWVMNMLRNQTNKHDKLATDFTDYKYQQAKDSYTKNEVNEMVRETKDAVKRIYQVIERLDSKIDERK